MVWLAFFLFIFCFFCFFVVFVFLSLCDDTVCTDLMAKVFLGDVLLQSMPPNESMFPCLDVFADVVRFYVL